jgi:predicted small secreted protein
VKAGIFWRRAALISLTGVLLALTGCNTVAGFGEDITNSARTVQRAL